ncbi:hypothetical protein GGTG_00984 [Gaeumannomyces tritici R3-111a-1]|uniref:Uncharacterized protein n=1 Tax=Gaeumannomyces tritici (strain R3-111a-1) TaxID=644352 RepID=J3NIA1_GAET3|nr:hypothetical protein GGTG_00984 [Gaeumannomyces tritici R3-111a-1]EJT80994.1 hypothetical protein GGTG_00984 [Gaeumannomyces tritici R3-111a-1]
MACVTGVKPREADKLDREEPRRVGGLEGPPCPIKAIRVGPPVRNISCARGRPGGPFLGSL